MVHCSVLNSPQIRIRLTGWPVLSPSLFFNFLKRQTFRLQGAMTDGWKTQLWTRNFLWVYNTKKGDFCVACSHLVYRVKKCVSRSWPEKQIYCRFQQRKSAIHVALLCVLIPNFVGQPIVNRIFPSLCWRKIGDSFPLQLFSQLIWSTELWESFSLYLFSPRRHIYDVHQSQQMDDLRLSSAHSHIRAVNG